GDLRKITNTLQTATALSKNIDADSLYKITATARPEEVKELMEKALKGGFLEARTVLDNLLITYGLSGEDVIKQIHSAVFDLGVPDIAKVALVDKIGEIEFRMVEGSNERIQLEALLAHLCVVGKGLKG
ncbi:MAG: Replication factor C small subunit, partial [Candidatus Thermoplasmatota archaeon]|nr:Replication factor C small subunit [Candidatus Thermoplasmatota archaeon]